MSHFRDEEMEAERGYGVCPGRAPEAAKAELGHEPAVRFWGPDLYHSAELLLLLMG